MKKRLAVLTLLLACCFALIGCGTKDDRTVVTFWHTMGKENQGILENIIKKFEQENPDIRVDHVQKGDYDDLRDAVTKAFAAGEQPSLTYSYPDHVAVYRNAGKAVNLLQYINDPVLGYTQDEIDDFIPEYYNEGVVVEGSETYVFSLPYAKSTEIMFYNKTFFDANSLTYPKTWDDVYTVSTSIRAIVNEKIATEVNNDSSVSAADKAQTIAARQKDVTPFGYDSEANLFITLTEQYGSPYTNANGEFLFNNAQNKEFVTKLKGWYDGGLLTSKEMLQGAYTSNKFTEEKLYMSVGSSGGTKYNIPSADGVTKELDFEVGVAPVPQVDVNSPKVIQQGPNITMLTNTEAVQDASWKFLKFLLTPENNAAYAISTGYSAVTTAAQQTPAYVATMTDDNPEYFTSSDVFRLVRELCKQYESEHAYYTSPAFEGSTQARTEVGSIITSVFAGTKNVDDAFADAIKNVSF